MYGIEEPRDEHLYRSLRDCFTATLDKVAGRLTRQRALILLLDGLDHFGPAVAVRSLSWLPDSWPKHVHVVLTTDSADELTMRNLGNHVKRVVDSQGLDRSAADECFYEIDPLDIEEQLFMVQNLRKNNHREFTADQHQVNLAVSRSTFNK